MKIAPAYLRGNQLWSVSSSRDWKDQMILQGQATKLQLKCAIDSQSSTEISNKARESAAESLDPRLAQLRTEAVLLLSKTALSPRKLAQLAHLADATQARTLVRQLNQVYESHCRAIRIEHVAGGYRMFTHASLSPWLTRLGHLPTMIRISTPMMETLSVVAYQQPVSRASAEAIRGVGCGEILRQLMERDLVRIVGRSEDLGRPYLYGTTKRFLKIFGLHSVEALPPINIDTLADDPIENSTNDDLSTSKKELVVSSSVAPVLAETDIAELDLKSNTPSSSGDETTGSIPNSQIEDEENEFYNDDDDDEDDDDNWSNDGDDDWDEDDLDDDDDDDGDGDEDDLDAEENAWEEVDDSDDGDDDEDDDDDWEDDDWEEDQADESDEDWD